MSVVAGIADADIRKDVLAWTELDSKDDKGVVAFVEAKEIAQAAWTGTQTSGTGGVSTYRKGPKSESEVSDQPLKLKLALKGKCNKCNKDIVLYKKYQSGKINNKAFKMCRLCHLEENSRYRSNNSGMAADTTTSSLESFFIGGIAEVDDSTLPAGAQRAAVDTDLQENTGVQSINDQPSPSINDVTLDHHIFTAEGWQRASALSHPSLRLRMTTCQEDYDKFGITYPRIQLKHVEVVVDSGAQSCLWSRRSFLRSGFTQKDLIPVNAVTEVAETGSTVYAKCGCLKRELPPEKPAQLPFQCTLENVDTMKDWLLTRYASSAFNKCPHQKLPAIAFPMLIYKDLSLKAADVLQYDGF